MITYQDKPLSWWLYPPYPWRGKYRQRTYSVLQTAGPGEPLRLIDETGEVTYLPSEDSVSFYRMLSLAILCGGRTVYCHNLKVGRRNAGLVHQAMLDHGAHVLYSPRRGLMGYTFRRGSQRGALLGMGAWGEKRAPDSHWLRSIRRLVDLVGVGDYDTAGALGQATLTRYWHEAGLPYQWRLGQELTAQLLRYQVGGRAEAPGLGSEFPSAIEYDLSSAYPTACARGLPTGRICSHNQRNNGMGNRPLFGVWRITCHSAISLSPVPYREWERNGSPLQWSLTPDNGPFEYAGWGDEVDTLRDRYGASVTVDFLRGWSWDRLDTLLAPWVDQLSDMRATCERDGLHEVGRLVKLTANAAIGRWGMDPTQYTLIPDAEHDLSLGDTPLQIEQGQGSDDAILGAWVRLTDTESRTAMPFHWSSYVRMAVRMELWRKTMEVMSQGYRVGMTNFDAVWIATPDNQPVSLPTVQQSQESHPFTWRPKRRAHTRILANRSVIWEDENGIQLTLPGMSQGMRMAVLVEHQRKRAERLEAERREVSA